MISLVIESGKCNGAVALLFHVPNTIAPNTMESSENFFKGSKEPHDLPSKTNKRKTVSAGTANICPLHKKPVTLSMDEIDKLPEQARTVKHEIEESEIDPKIKKKYYSRLTECFQFHLGESAKDLTTDLENLKKQIKALQTRKDNKEIQPDNLGGINAKISDLEKKKEAIEINIEYVQKTNSNITQYFLHHQASSPQKLRVSKGNREAKRGF